MENATPLLLVDDEEGILIVLGALLEDMGYAVCRASSGRKALELFESIHPPIVMTDIKMPGMDGIALLRRIREIDENAEVLMLTGHGDMDLAVESLRNGAGDFLNKPVSDSALEVALDRAKERIALRETLRRYTEELELLVEQRTRELIESERFAAVGQTAASLAHSIKNIAGALEGTMYVLEKGLELNKREYFEQGWQMVRSDVSRLRTLAVGLLDLGRPVSLSFAAHDPDKPARDVAELLASKAQEAGIRMELDLQAGPDSFHMDVEAVHRCLLNLLLNALEACEHSPLLPGKRLVRLCSRRESAADGDGEDRESARVVYILEDNGPGFPEHGAEGLSVQHFQSGKPGGSGIGLFSTRKTAHEMGADLQFSSREGGGARVSLTLRGQTCQ